VGTRKVLLNDLRSMGLCGHQEIQAIQRDLGQHTYIIC
jgi:hypothetical protein